VVAESVLFVQADRVKMEKARRRSLFIVFFV